jgi:hypothetical protein
MMDTDRLPTAVKELLANKKFKFANPVFESYNAPHGFLERDIACHALFYYAMLARKAYEETVVGVDIQYEDALSNKTDFRMLYESIAFLYGVHPAQMQRYWPAVDMQLVALQLPQLPKEDRYRHDKVPEFKTQ